MSKTAVGSALLTVEELWAGYGPVQVLHGVSFTLEPGQVVGGHRALPSFTPTRGRRRSVASPR